MSLSESVESLFNQAKIHHQQNNYVEAISLLQKIIGFDKNYIDAYLELSILFHKTKRADLARRMLDEALAINPDHINTLLLYADFLKIHQQYDLALDFYHRILILDTNNVDALFKKATILQKTLCYQEALAAYETALTVKPDDLLCLNNKGTILIKMGHYEEALTCFLNIVNTTPRNEMIHTNIATCFTALGQYKKALPHYQRSLDIDPDNIDTITAYANLLSRMGYAKESLEQYARILRLAPETAEAQWAYCISSIMAKREEISDNALFEKTALASLKELENGCSAQHNNATNINATNIVGLYQFFGLAYIEADNTALLREHGKLCCHLMKKWLAEKNISVSFSSPDMPIKIGIISANMTNHSVWRAIIKGIVEQLDKTLFEIHLFSLDASDKERQQWAAQHCKYVEQNLFHTGAWVQSILNHRLDIIFYPAIGMNMITLQLASLRLAPIQIAGWGHPETSGLPTIDYYLSSQAFEPNDAQHHYTEPLLMLPRIGSCFTPLSPPSTQVDLASLGVNAKGPVFISPGMVLKYQPQYDYIFVEIAKQLKTCTFLFFKNKPLYLYQKFEDRLRNIFTSSHLSFEDYVHFLPWQPTAAFFSTMKQADVYLDTIGFSGFNTAMQAMECKLPIVTCEGQFMRGRFASGILRTCGLDALIATTPEEYVQIAVKLASDSAYRQAIQQKINQAHSVIFDDKNTIKALENILLALVKKDIPH